MKDPIELIDALQHPNVKAFLWMLRYGEGTSGPQGFRVVFGGGHFLGPDGLPDTFDDFKDHPRKVITRTFKNGVRVSSTAAGAYQYLSKTWDGLVAQYGFNDFSPRNQDLGAVALVKGRGALEDIKAGRFEVAVQKCNKEWASLPGSPYGQPVVTMAEARAHYEKHGGAYITHNPAPLLESALTQAPVATEPKEPPMAPFIAAALPALISAIPDLARMFGSGSEVSERNIKAAELVVGIAKEAIGAKNEQELVESMQSDPAAVSTVRDAVRANWFQLEEVGGGIVAARDSNAKVQGDKGLVHNPAVWITAALLPLVYFTVIRVLAYDGFSDEMKVMVVTAVISGILGAITGYWLGTSASSKAKDDALFKR